jgi:hypothetical protein
MVGAASNGWLLARPKSGIAARLPQVAPSNPPRATAHRSSLPPARQWQHHRVSSLITCHSPLITRQFLIAGEKILKTELTPSVPTPNAFLIAGDFPFFSSAAAPRISNRYTKLLEIELTRSQSTKDRFLIDTICPTFTPAPLSTHHLSPITKHCLTQFLIATNETHKILALLKTKEKQLSIRYKFALRAAGAAHHESRITNHESRLTIHHAQILRVFQEADVDLCSLTCRS